MFESLLNFYRRSLKRVPMVHRAAYVAFENLLVPLLEKVRRFRTIPDDPLNFRLQLLLQRYEPETVRFFKEHIKPGMIVLDIGAHMGYYTRLFSRLVGPNGRVIAFEPHPIHFQYLQKNTNGLSNVILINKAVGNKAGMITLYDYAVESGCASVAFLDEEWSWVRQKSSQEISPRIRDASKVGRTFKVEVTTLDAALDEIGLSHIDALKMDIEGAEILALRGAANTLSSSEAIMVFEFAPTRLKAFGHDPVELFKVLRNYGYDHFGVLTNSQIDTLSPESEDFDKIVDDLAKDFSSCNCVAWKGGRP